MNLQLVDVSHEGVRKARNADIANIVDFGDSLVKDVMIPHGYCHGGKYHYL
ncbi:MAG: hypothetical protein ACLSCU_07625 [Eubacterium sp.]